MAFGKHRGGGNPSSVVRGLSIEGYNLYVNSTGRGSAIYQIAIWGQLNWLWKTVEKQLCGAQYV